MITRTIFTVAAFLTLSAAPAFAQQHQHGGGQGHGDMMGQDHMMQGMRGMHERMMGTMHTQPAMLLHASEALGLTPEQTERLTALRDRTQPEHRQHMQASMEAHERAATILETDAPDLDAYEAAMNQAADHMVMAHVAMTRTSLEAKAVLTPDQREKLHEVVSGMGEMHEGMMEGGKGHGGRH